jgi:glyoxylase I family protein
MATVRFAHVALVCDDPLAVERWYTEHFGFTRTRVYDPGPGQVVMIRQGDIELEIFKAETPRPDGPPREAGPMYPCWRHIAFVVDDLDASLAGLGDATPVTLGPLDMAAYIPGMRVAWVADPAGNIVELNQGYVDQADPPSLADDLAARATAAARATSDVPAPMHATAAAGGPR